VCSMASRERSIYREAWVLRGSGKVDMLAATPASVGARRWRSNGLHVQAKLTVVTAWSGGVSRARFPSMSGGGVYGIVSSSPAAAVQGRCSVRVWRV
jgi:hypothetical protein